MSTDLQQVCWSENILLARFRDSQPPAEHPRLWDLILPANDVIDVEILNRAEEDEIASVFMSQGEGLHFGTDELTRSRETHFFHTPRNCDVLETALAERRQGYFQNSCCFSNNNLRQHFTSLRWVPTPLNLFLSEFFADYGTIARH
jgi:hypothetical protein